MEFSRLLFRSRRVGLPQFGAGAERTAGAREDVAAVVRGRQLGRHLLELGPHLAAHRVALLLSIEGDRDDAVGALDLKCLHRADDTGADGLQPAPPAPTLS